MELIDELEAIIKSGLYPLEGRIDTEAVSNLIVENIEYILERDWKVEARYLKRPWERYE